VQRDGLRCRCSCRAHAAPARLLLLLVCLLVLSRCCVCAGLRWRVVLRCLRAVLRCLWRALLAAWRCLPQRAGCAAAGGLIASLKRGLLLLLLSCLRRGRCTPRLALALLPLGLHLAGGISTPGRRRAAAMPACIRIMGLERSALLSLERLVGPLAALPGAAAAASFAG
jgi:hypothetical protein